MYYIHGKQKVLLVTCYLPPSNSKYAFTYEDLQNLFNFIKKAKTKVDDIIMHGDFNFPAIDWNMIPSRSSIKTEFLNLMEQINLEQKINLFTASTRTLTFQKQRWNLNF